MNLYPRLGEMKGDMNKLKAIITYPLLLILDIVIGWLLGNYKEMRE